MKKFLSMIAAAVLAVACLAGCGDSSSKSDASSSSSSSSSAASSSAAESSSVVESSSAADSSEADSSAADSSSEADEPSSSEADSSAAQDGNIKASLVIDVSDILKNYDKLDKGLQSDEFVPQSGKILDETEFEVESGKTVYDLMVKATEEKGIKLDAKKTDYGMYIDGINSVATGSVGQTSGWMFKVNGKDSEVGADAYKLQAGDKVEFFYVCDYNAYYANQQAA